MIDPITEILITEVPNDTLMQVKFKAMIDDETRKCKKITGGSDFLKCKILATSYAVKKFLYKYGNASDEVVEMVQETLRKIEKDP